jgi:ribonuclease HI
MDNIFEVYCDGGARGNPGPAASAFVVYDSDKRVISEDGRTIGFTTNNQAEYQAVLMAFEWLAVNVGEDAVIRVYLDSQLLVNQLSGKFRVKDPALKEKYLKIYEILKLKRFALVSFMYIPRERNSRADFLVNLALDKNFI